MTFFYEMTLYLALCLIPAAIASGLYISLQTLGRLQGKDVMENKAYFPYISFFKLTKPEYFWESLLFSVQLTKFLYYLVFGFVSFYFLFLAQSLENSKHIEQLNTPFFYASSFLEIIIILLISLSIEVFLTLLIEKRAEKSAKILSFPVAVLMIPCLPFIFCYLKCKNIFSSSQKQ